MYIKARIFIFKSNQLKAKNNPDWGWGVKNYGKNAYYIFPYILLHYFVKD